MNGYKDLINSAPVVLVEFFATWCIHCQHMMPVVAEVKAQVAGKAEIYQLDVDKNPELSEAEGVNGTPTFILYKDGKEVWRNAGEMPAEVLLKHILG